MNTDIFYWETLQKIKEIESVISQDIGRGITPLSNLKKGELLSAAISIAEHPKPSIAIITGFYIPHANPPSAETDGLVGSAHLAAGFSKLGIPVRLVTDSLCFNALRVAVQAAGALELVSFDVVPVNSFEDYCVDIARVKSIWETLNPSISHIISIERVGPNKDGAACNMKGEDITAHTAPLNLLFISNDKRVTIGIGDGGNELGMGSVPYEIIRNSVKYGEVIACTVPADYLIVCGVSNWGAIGLLSSISLLRLDWSKPLLEILTLERDFKILKETVLNGPAVDGVTKFQNFSVDNLPWSDHADILDRILKIVESG